ncbi:hypothetical protein SODALDRAFT_331116 [Sodiomyces alkalinus F11]|uniref:Uncharacterized protein n=1 Tax=Sodiomyces alkalinus (strain CBS 110278 / VKM F-3762 / F11) TaxID=1314773 RepID=A0A3N2Q3V4_SODAK|nr:hypothetical protein SODALDRAFT_331116 [Sodiomyces alkalinus F11]ROT41396.1 hypothetical protein SODALDRAFT_331116 [Sodiomyces alkalinus F11]
MSSRPFHKEADPASPRYPRQVYLRLPDDYITGDAVPHVSPVYGPDPRPGSPFRLSLHQYPAYDGRWGYHHDDEELPSWTTRSKDWCKTSMTKLRNALTIAHKQSPIVTCCAYGVMLFLFLLWITSLFRGVWA